VNTDDYEKGRRRGEQIESMRVYHRQQGLQRLRDFGVANMESLNNPFRRRSEEYRRRYADGMHSETT
jgi:hypothetical protein